MYAEVVHFPNPWAANPVRIVGIEISPGHLPPTDGRPSGLLEAPAVAIAEGQLTKAPANR